MSWKPKPYMSVRVWQEVEPWLVIEGPIVRGLYNYYRVRNVHGHEKLVIEGNLEEDKSCNS